MITVDVRNAFNTADWARIIEALEAKGVTRHLVEIVKDYLTGRTIYVEKDLPKLEEGKSAG